MQRLWLLQDLQVCDVSPAKPTKAKDVSLSLMLLSYGSIYCDTACKFVAITIHKTHYYKHTKKPNVIWDCAFSTL